MISRDIRKAAQSYSDIRRLFLCDGDALILPQKRLLALLDEINEHLPRLTRISTYASAKAIGMKTDAQLAELFTHGLTMLYMGLESGDDEVLRRVRKHGTAADMITQAHRAKAAGMKLNVTVLLGLGGRALSTQHARATGQVLTEMQPEQAAALSLMLVPGTELHEQAAAGQFEELTPPELLRELQTILEHLHLEKGLFMANHASNHLPMKIRLPGGKAKALAMLDEALAGERSLKPEELRGL